MFQLYKNLVFLLLSVFFDDIVCFCEESHIVMCDELNDYKNNDTIPWRHIQIGSLDYRHESSHDVLSSNLIFHLQYAKSLTIINRINRIDVFLLVYTSRLEYLNFYSNDVVEIEDYTFKDLPNIKEIYLEKNNLRHLVQGIFQNTSLELVNLSRNLITSVTTCFYYSRIKWILLNHNRIRFIKNDAFPSNLEQLEVNGNLLETIQDGVFSNLKNLKELYLENNLLKTIPDIAKLTNIQYLHLAYNRIQEVHYPFDQHKKLELLDLSANSIRNVTVDAFTGTEIPPIVILSFNRLTNIVFPRPTRKTDLVLSGNPWNCNCLFHIEKLIERHKHMTSCVVKVFDKGQVPFCIESGPCDSNTDISATEIDHFLNIINVCETEVKDLCNFRFS